MKRTLIIPSLAAALMPLALGQPAFAHESESHAQQQHYSGSVTYTDCRKSPGTTGLVVGGVAGGLIGGGLIGGGLIGPLIGAVGGAFAGRAIDRESTKPKRCKAVREDEPRQQPQELAPSQRYSDDYYQDDLYADGPSTR